MVKHPIILLPFFIVAFLEGLALELIYFSTRKPISFIAAPIIRKFSGEAFLHYPFHLVKLPKHFYYSQILIYIFFAVFLTAITINIVRNIKAGLPLKTNALIKNALNRYLSFVVFGIIMTAMLLILQRVDTIIFSKLAFMVSKRLPQLGPAIFSIASMIFFFLTNVILYLFLLLALPIIVIKKKSLLGALGKSIGLGFLNFLHIFTLIFLPLFLYLPVTVLKGYSSVLAHKTFPEMTLLIVAFGIIIAAFVDCFIFVCATSFILEKEPQSTGAQEHMSTGTQEHKS
jgi:hypothetical protein